MSSILTNTSAMVALQTLKGINSNLAKTQDEISTGKSVSSSKDNAAVWAISKTMESDVAGFTAISDSLALGEETVSVARKAAETVVDLLTKMKGQIVGAQASGDARAKLQTDIDALQAQVESITSAAQFGGMNLLSNTSQVAGSGKIDVLSSLDRSATGVTAASIKADKQDLGTKASVVTGVAVATLTNGLTGAADATAVVLTGAATPPTTTLVIDATNDAIVAGTGYSIAIAGGAGSFATGFNTTAGDANQISYVARDGDTEADVAKGVADAFNKYTAKFADANPTLAGMSTVAATVSGSTITFTGSNVATHNFSVAGNSYDKAGNTIGGGLAALARIDVTTDAGAKSALADIETLIKTATDAAADFGSVQGRLEIQSKFISGLTDSLKAGIGTLVDADMEEASARLQALQVQQQLGVQALSIANQAPQSILSLFR